MTAITLPRAVVEQALEALEGIQWPGSPSFVKAAITALRERLTQPEQEPVQFKCTVIDDVHSNGIPLEQWTTPPQRKPLTDEQIAEALGFGEHTTATTRAILTHAARAIEAKIKENK